MEKERIAMSKSENETEKRISLRIDEELHSLLSREASKQGLSLNTFIKQQLQAGTEALSYHKLTEFAEHSRYLISLVIYISTMMDMDQDEETRDEARKKTALELKYLGLYSTKNKGAQEDE
jgi:uncharacterized protein (DUF1778 family)